MIPDDWNEIKTVASEILVDVFGSENGNIVVPKKQRVSLKGQYIQYDFIESSLPHRCYGIPSRLQITPSVLCYTFPTPAYPVSALVYFPDSNLTHRCYAIPSRLHFTLSVLCYIFPTPAYLSSAVVYLSAIFSLQLKVCQRLSATMRSQRPEPKA
ncbi:hypothetical protein EVAR_45314_1 [Eumeta japonica]|uniref:Uncharacterized protein n=1 Tax=Eumeta variegata TaxID=151549 RepID=A0A4C1XK09_EUMVA|nr:hypothetical protein EVAR_45314_1 [Eumeta japonica]